MINEIAAKLNVVFASTAIDFANHVVHGIKYGISWTLSYEDMTAYADQNEMMGY